MKKNIEIGDLVEVISLEEGRNSSNEKYVGKTFLVHDVSTVWYHNICLTHDPFMTPDADGFDDVLIQKCSWHESELRIIEKRDVLLTQTLALLNELSPHPINKVFLRLTKLTRRYATKLLCSDEIHFINQMNRFVEKQSYKKIDSKG